MNTQYDIDVAEYDIVDHYASEVCKYGYWINECNEHSKFIICTIYNLSVFRVKALVKSQTRIFGPPPYRIDFAKNRN